MEEQSLQRKLTPINIWALALGCIIGWGAFVMPGNTFLLKAGPLGTAIAMAIAVVIISIIALNYSFMLNKYTVSGGEYIYTKEVFGKTNSFICSWFLGLSYLMIVPLNGTAVALVGRSMFNDVLKIGFHYKVAGFDVFFGEILLAIGVILALGWLSIRGVRFSGLIQTILVFVLVGGVLIIIIAAIISNKTSITNLKPVFNPNNESILGGILAVLAVTPFAFVGFDTIPQASEEFNFSAKKTNIIMIISIVFGAFMYVALNTIAAIVWPTKYNSWVDYIADSSNLDGISSFPTINAAYIICGRWGLILIGLSFLAAILSGIIGFYMASSRLLFSLARDGLLPKWFGKVHDKYKTPVNAILFVMSISIIAPFFGRTALGWIVDMSSLGAAIGYGYTSAAAAVIAKREGKGIVFFTGIIGTVMSIIFGVLLLVPIPIFNCSLGKEGYICLGIWSFLGALFYFKSIKGRKLNEENDKSIDYM